MGSVHSAAKLRAQNGGSKSHPDAYTKAVFSQSAGKWVDGQISSVDVNDASVTLRIEYQIDKHPCRKTLKETSEHLKKIPPAADASSEISSSFHSDMLLSWKDRLDEAWRASMGGTRIR